MSESLQKAASKVSESKTREELLEEKVAALEAAVASRDAEIELLVKQVAGLVSFQRAWLGRSTERSAYYCKESLSLFDHARSEKSLEEAASKTVAPRKIRRKGHGRRKVPIQCERVIEDVVLPPQEALCPCCQHPRRVFGFQPMEQIKIIAPKFQVLESRRYKYVCDQCEGQQQTAPMPPHVLPKFLLTPSAMAQVIVMKYAHHLPVYRLITMLDKHRELSDSTIQGEVIEASRLLSGIHKLLKPFVLESAVLHVDDTPVRQLRGPGQTGYLWPYVGDDNHPAVVFEYTTGRSGKFPQEFLSTYQGRFIQVDGFPGFHPLFEGPKGFVEVGCWCHARRKILEALGPPIPEIIARHEGLNLINSLFKLEAEIKKKLARRPDQDPKRREKIICRWRRRIAQPLLEKFQAWMDRSVVLPKSPMGKALKYIRKHWLALTVYVRHACLDISNLEAERVIRPVALGRKNWNFVGSPAGGKAAAIFYSLIATCKRQGIDPTAYLTDVLGRIANFPANRQEELLPWNWKPAASPAVMSQAA